MNPIIQSLQIIDEAGYPVYQATVLILNDSNQIIGKEATDPSGFVILKLDKNAKRVRVSHEGYQKVELPTLALKDESYQVINLR